MSGEIWRDVPSVPGILVSSEVRIVYAPHREPMPNGGTRSYGGQPTFGVWAKDEGRFVTRFRRYKVHRLVAKAFFGPRHSKVRGRCTSTKMPPIIGHRIALGDAERKPQR